jgi:antitoxin component YwqK of YwqJK toxin-antitoxin module
MLVTSILSLLYQITLMNVLVNKYKKYTTNPKYVYKLCKGLHDTNKWIVIMKKLQNTTSDEDRSNIVDTNYAIYRANELQVVRIFNINSLKSIKKITHRDRFNEPTIYIKGNIMCNTYYYKNITAAYHTKSIDANYTGKWCVYYDNGCKEGEYNIVNGKYHGIWTKWYSNEKKSEEGYYNHGVKIGHWRSWYVTGELMDYQ